MRCSAAEAVLTLATIMPVFESLSLPAKQQPPPTSQEQAKGPCMREWCDAREAPWEKKCTWQTTCKGCSDCTAVCPQWCTKRGASLEWKKCANCREKNSPDGLTAKVRDTETVNQNFAEFTMDCSQNGSKGPPYGTNCPEPKWVDEMIRADPSPGKTIVNIGCNKGNDIARWMELWDMSASHFWSQTAWNNQLTKRLWNITAWNNHQPYFACEPNSDYVTARMVKPPSQTSDRAVPTGVCVEPMPKNVNLLRDISKVLGYRANTGYGSFHLVQAAAVAKASPGETVPFPVERPGYEQASLSEHSAELEHRPVPVKTVDTIVDELGLHDVDILLIDTEGYDAEVLKGANRTLAKVRYLEFEVHRDFGPWSSTSLKSVVSNLDEQGFDCYWAGNNGKLTAIKECWIDDFERGTWANAVCAKRGDAWSKVMRLAASWRAHQW